MKSSICLALSVLMFPSALPLHAETAAASGATMGEWTQDYEAALKLAGEKKLPILLNFSGSDWCGWCKLMATNVFTQEQWKAYAKENIVTVLIDFPKDKSLVPEKFHERNKELNDRFDVKGFPTYIVLDSNGTVLGQLGASREATPSSFIQDLAGNLKYRENEVKRYCSTLSEDDAGKYQAIFATLTQANAGIAEARTAMAEAAKKIEVLQKSAAEIEAQATEFRASQKGKESLDAFRQLKAEHDKAIAELEAFLKSGPERNKETMEKVRGFRERIEELSDKLSAF